jgi:hypothetical protein
LVVTNSSQRHYKSQHLSSQLHHPRHIAKSLAHPLLHTPPWLSLDAAFPTAAAAMNVNKKLDRFAQWSKEKVSKDAPKTTADDEFKGLEQEMNTRYEG